MAQKTIKADSAMEHSTRPTFLSDHLSNERTYLSYLRTAVSLMSFGIAINRFSLFLEQSCSAPSAHPPASAAQLGIGMVAIGMALLAWAAVRYVLILHHIEQQDFRPRPGSILILTALVLVFALGGVVWLFID
jgi:putative membrane protein